MNSKPRPVLPLTLVCTILLDMLETHDGAFNPRNDFDCEEPEASLGDRRFRRSYAGGIETVREATNVSSRS
jgi:hypothetical protein